jgi:hypothetical protein
LFIPQEYVEKNSDSRIAKYGKYAAMGTLSTIASPIVITATVVNLATIGALGVVATPIALVASPIYYAYLKYNKQIYNNNIKTINKLTLLESLLFIPQPESNYKKLIENTRILVNYNNIVTNFGSDVVNKIQRDTNINEKLYNKLINSITPDYDIKKKVVLSSYINNINNLIYFFTKFLDNNTNSAKQIIFAKQIISSLEHIKEYINNLKTELIKNEEKAKKDRYELRLNKLQKRKFEITEKLLKYKELKKTFGYINVIKIQKETGINTELYEKLIKAINDKNINLFNIKKLIDFFEKLKYFNKTKAVEIINLLNNIIQTDYFRLLVETTKELVDYYNIVAKFGRIVVNKIQIVTGINELEYKNLVNEIKTENINKTYIQKLINFFTKMISLDINEKAKREAEQIINSLKYLNKPNAVKIINLLDNILLTNDPKSLVETTKELVDYNNIVTKFGSNVVNKIQIVTDINELIYKELISDIGGENKDKQQIQTLIDFFTKMRSLDINENVNIYYANKIINLLKYVKTLHNSTLNIIQLNKTKYGKYVAMGTLGIIASPIALVASPIYYAYLKYNKQIYNNNKKTINKLTLLESLLFIPQEYVEKNSNSRIAKYAAMGTLGIIASPIVITAQVVHLATIGALGVVATPIALVASPIYYAYLKYNKQIYNNNIKTINKLTLLESLLFIPKPKISSIAHNKLRLLESLLFVPQTEISSIAHNKLRLLESLLFIP